MPRAFIIAGPNGAGKSTLAARFVPREVPFLNADEIARQISVPGQSADIAAGRLLLERLGEMEQSRASFALETSLANRTLAARIPRWREAGYEVLLLFVWIPSADLAVQRVASRVRSGGHGIPEATIRRRYETGLRLFFDVYQPLVDVWRLYDNSGPQGAVLVAQSRIRQRETWEHILAEVRHEQ
ncbi:MAG: dephospho-CoA kinase [Armatimonadetes bacterium]|nr:dephospho-CoA kinase [Armatimonadota bacterium]